MPSLRIRRPWAIVAMIFLFMLINYADKAVIGLSAVPIMKELHLTGTQFGAVGSAFFVFFSLSGVLGGFLSNHVASKVLIGVMAVIWAVAQAPMIGTVSFTTLLAARMALGAGEGPAFPLALHAVYKWFDNERRAGPTGVIACGAAFGAGVVAPGITAIILHYGWHAAFGTLAAASLVWALAWAIFGAEGTGDLAAPGIIGNTRVPYRTLILSRTALGVFIGGFVAYWALTLNIVWLAAYLVKGVGVTQKAAGWLLVLPSFTQIVLALGLGALSDRLVRGGVTSRLARGMAGGLCLIGAGLAMVAFPLASGLAVKIPLIVVAFSLGSVFFTLGTPLIGEITPPAQRGALLGITNSIHALAGLLAPLAMGVIVDVGVDPAAGFRTGFVAAGLFVAAGGVLAMALIHPQADRDKWRLDDADRLATVPAGAVASHG